MMGGQCNFTCRHCIQQTGMPSIEKSRPVPDVLQYIECIAKKTDSLLLMFWGGEPLLYIDTIKYTIQRLSNKNIQYAIITNGLLLNKSIVDFINYHHIRVTLSNDGTNTDKVRPLNTLENDCICNAFKQIQYKGIEACVTAYNQDYYDTWDYLEKKVGKQISIFNSPLRISWDMPHDLWDYDLIAYKERMQNIVQKAWTGLLKEEINREYLLLQPTVTRILRKIEGKSLSVLRCGQGYNTVNIDLSGNVYACHNGTWRLGTIADDEQVLHDKFLHYLDTHTMSECKTCEYADVCGLRCPNMISSEGSTKCCEREKIFIQACFHFISKIQQYAKKRGDNQI